MTRLCLTLGCLLVTATAHAGLLTVDFSQGPLGNLGTPNIVQGGVTVTATGGDLYRWNGFHCCDHEDFGLGVLGPTDGINPAHPEIGVGEQITLTRLPNHRWQTIYFSSVNTSSTGVLLADATPFAFVSAGVGPFSSATSGGVLIPDAFSLANTVTFRPFGPTADNYTVLWKVDFEKGETVVPEPGTLTMLGFGLLGLRRFTRKGTSS